MGEVGVPVVVSEVFVAARGGDAFDAVHGVGALSDRVVVLVEPVEALVDVGVAAVAEAADALGGVEVVTDNEEAGNAGGGHGDGFVGDLAVVPAAIGVLVFGTGGFDELPAVEADVNCAGLLAGPESEDAVLADAMVEVFTLADIIPHAQVLGIEFSVVDAFEESFGVALDEGAHLGRFVGDEQPDLASHGDGVGADDVGLLEEFDG